MSYTPTIWETGDVITADKLNNIEQGILNVGEWFVITATNVANSSNPATAPTLDKTFSEITDAINAGKLVGLKVVEESGNFFFVTETAVIYNNSEISMVLFTYNTGSMSPQNKWHVTNTAVTIANNMTASAFKEADFAT